MTATVSNFLISQPGDVDRQETAEWLEALDATIAANGSERGRYLIAALQTQAYRNGVLRPSVLSSPYRNTIPPEREPEFPGDLAVEERITAIIRWNAMAMVARANKAYGELGGHIASYASAAEIFETGFNHFFRGPNTVDEGDIVYFQPHSAPGIYARAFLEGSLDEGQLKNYRREVGGVGLSSYPHPWLMPDFWQVPTGSMGIGPLSAIYQARFLRYLAARGLGNTDGRHVWGVFGDGEMDEPESIAALTLASRENLDNLTFIINCNLQRLDGPVRGNGQIVSELEKLFAGAGWNVIKVLWATEWDDLFARDRTGALERRLAGTVDGEFQTLGANNGDYNLRKFFQSHPDIANLVADADDEEIGRLRRGGHDMRKLHAAFASARSHSGAPSVILAKTKKGYGMGSAGESRMTAHQTKKLDTETLMELRDRYRLPISDDSVESLQFYHPGEESPEIQYLRRRRAELGGFLPRRTMSAATLTVPVLSDYAKFSLTCDGKEMSTTMVAVRLLGNLLKDKELGRRIVPIVADEARTFGMANLFRQVGIYAPHGQSYDPEDSESMLFYKESRDGQILEEGITEAGAMASWTAAATAYSIHKTPLLPFYIYYSMFGFQRVGDIIWAAADQRARGFLIGATAGRTTLAGEGLQHQDGHSHVAAAAVPNCRAYDPAFSYELAVIIDHGMREMLERRTDVFYYITVMNESYRQPSLPEGVAEEIIKGMYRLEIEELKASKDERHEPQVRLLGSGALLPEVIEAARLLASDWGIAADIFSVTSFSELAREAREVQRQNRLNPRETPRISHVAQCLAGSRPIVATTDYVCAYPQLISPYLSAPFLALGTDGFGRSDTRAALRRFFEVDRYQIVVAALHSLVPTGQCCEATVSSAIERYKIDADSMAPWLR